MAAHEVRNPLGVIRGTVELMRERSGASLGEGELRLVAGVDAGGVRGRVEDDGPGGPPGLRERLFEVFVTGRTEGTGLGLALCRRLVE
ncbi:hypothetical protein KGD87_15270 [Myxococcus sp. SDU36]|nr:hypothetical protein KGD87_15270 [Myxococcus sp. SDU36]